MVNIFRKPSNGVIVFLSQSFNTPFTPVKSSYTISGTDRPRCTTARDDDALNAVRNHQLTIVLVGSQLRKVHNVRMSSKTLIKKFCGNRLSLNTPRIRFYTIGETSTRMATIRKPATRLDTNNGRLFSSRMNAGNRMIGTVCREDEENALLHVRECHYKVNQLWSVRYQSLLEDEGSTTINWPAWPPHMNPKEQF